MKPRLPAPKAFLRAIMAAFLALGLLLPPAALAEGDVAFKRIPTQYIAALADPDANAGTGAQDWGLWRRDPGPVGVRLRFYKILRAAGGIAPGGWVFDQQDWWLEENGLIMEKPDFPLPQGQYLVTGAREVTTVLTVHGPDGNGNQSWELDDAASIYDVTHLRCRSARYTPASGENSCSPANANPAGFPVAPGAVMPSVTGCDQQDYSVLIVIGVAVEG